MKYATVLALAASSVAATEVIQIDPFHPRNFLKANLAEHLLKAATAEVTKVIHQTPPAGNPLAGGSPVAWAQCADAAGSFNLDTSKTTATPDPLTKGSDVALHLAGGLSSPIDIGNVHIHVDWNGTPLYDEDHKGESKYSDSVAYDLKWSVPSYAPDGKYVATITGVDNADGTKNDFCVSASFEFS
jgi:hypothetical protein